MNLTFPISIQHLQPPLHSIWFLFFANIVVPNIPKLPVPHLQLVLYVGLYMNLGVFDN